MENNFHILCDGPLEILQTCKKNDIMFVGCWMWRTVREDVKQKKMAL